MVSTFLFLAGLTVSGSATAEGIPGTMSLPLLKGEKLPRGVDTQPANWVRADLAVDDSGNLVRELFWDLQGKRLQRYLEAAEAGSSICRSSFKRGTLDIIGGYDPDRWHFRDLSDALDRADIILVGRVTHREVGFTFGAPAAMYRVSGVEVFRGHFDNHEAFFHLHDDVEVPLGDGCVRFGSNRGEGERPEVGDEILLLAETRYADQGVFGWIRNIFPESLIVFDSQTGGVRGLPRAFQQALEGPATPGEGETDPLLRELVDPARVGTDYRSWIFGLVMQADEENEADAEKEVRDELDDTVSTHAGPASRVAPGDLDGSSSFAAF